MIVKEVKRVSEEVVKAVSVLLPQLTDEAEIPAEDELAEIIASQSTTLFIARDEGKIVGMLTLTLFRIPTGIRAWIEDVVVDSRARGKGIGETMIRNALEKAKKSGAGSVNLTSRPSRQAANRLYQRMGFQKRATNVYRYPLV